jgi:hypothetical protein
VTPHRIAVVGGGPRGLSLVERLTAGAAAYGISFDITVYETGTAGAGRIWEPDQPRELLMNTRANEATIFADESVPVSLPVRTGPTLLEWARTAAAGDNVGLAAWPDLTGWSLPVPAPELVRACARLRPVDHAPRALFGRYLGWVFSQVALHAPDGTTVRQIRRRIVDVSNTDGGGWLVRDSSGSVREADAVALALGWLDATYDSAGAEGWIGPGNPLDQDLTGIGAGDTVLLTGLGMSMFDNMARLTLGRGGRFETLDDGSLRYQSSGNEPHLVVGSRSGAPYWPKPVLDRPALGFARPALEKVLARAGKLDFNLDIWSALVSDAATEFYRVLHSNEPRAFRLPLSSATALTQRLAGAGRAVSEDLGRLADTVLQDGAKGLRSHHLQGVTPPPCPSGDYTSWLRAALTELTAEAAQGDSSPLVRALLSVSGARARLADVLAEERLTAASRNHGYRQYNALAPRLGGGPPAERTRQLIALFDAGIARALGPGLSVNPGASGNRYTCTDHWRGHAAVDHVVESWLHRPTVRNTADPLLQALMVRGLATSYAATDATGSFETEALHVSPGDGGLITADGSPAAGLYALGIPSDEQLGHSVVSPVPRSGSAFLRRSDATASAILQHVAHHRALAGDASHSKGPE